MTMVDSLEYLEIGEVKVTLAFMAKFVWWLRRLLDCLGAARC